VREVVKACEQVAGRPIKTTGKPRRPGDPPRLVLSAEKAVNELGWKPEFPTLEAMSLLPGAGTSPSARLFGLRCVRISSLSL